MARTWWLGYLSGYGVKMRVIGHYKGLAKIFHPASASADD
ncbi:hypothetical protein YSA_07272 [Pseudomonas putida ND6]|uniref:Uncharacterized protein n=1 Tax=Pseudomonas putida ND6 TaxID=231023 RepID=I3UYY1_PSEPU|nr:hypothetical protein YSA_07272 [Pseudomonas putida ND6]